MEKETLTRQLLLNLKKSDLELKVRMVAPFRFQTWSQRQTEKFHVLKSSHMKFLPTNNHLTKRMKRIFMMKIVSPREAEPF